MYIHGVSFDTDFSSFIPSDAFSVDSRSNASGKSRKNQRGNAPDISFTANFILSTTDVWTKVGIIRGLIHSNEYIILRSSSQRLYNNSYSVYVKVDSFTAEHVPGYTHLTDLKLSGKIVGVPSATGGSESVAHYWSARPIPVPSDWKPVYFPWSEGGRNGLVYDTTLKDWVPDTTNRVSLIQASGTVTWAVTKDTDGRGVIQATTSGAATYARAVLTTNSSLKNGFFSCRFKTTNAQLVTMWIRETSTATSSNGYHAYIDFANSSVNLESHAGAAYTNIGSAGGLPSLRDDKWHTFSVYVNESTFILFVDGIAYLTVRNTTYTAGGYMSVGIHANAAQSVKLADVGHHPGLVHPAIPLDARSSPQDGLTNNRYRAVGPNLLGTSWRDLNWTSGRYIKDLSLSRSGQGSIRTLDASPDSNPTYYALPANTLVVGKTYILEGWAYTDRPSATQTVDMGGTSTYVSTSAVVQKGTGWRRGYDIFRVASLTDNTYVQLHGINGGGNTWWDDVSLRECVPVATDANKYRIISNSGAQ